MALERVPCLSLEDVTDVGTRTLLPALACRAFKTKPDTIKDIDDDSLVLMEEFAEFLPFVPATVLLAASLLRTQRRGL
jgi:hypothetical protein